MTDVSDDRFWVDTAEFVKKTDGAPQEIIAPREFEQLIPGIVGYQQRSSCPAPKVVVLHKGLLAELGSEWIENTALSLNPAFANEVFVVFTASRPAHRVGHPRHYAAFAQQLKKLGGPAAAEQPRRRLSIGERLRRLVRRRPERPPPSRAAVYVGDNRALVRTYDGHKMYVNTRDLGLAPHLLLDGFWEPDITRLFCAMVRPGMTVAEVGANIGYYSVLAAGRIGSHGHLFAFEPHPGCAELCSRNLHINGYDSVSTVIPKAVYSRRENLKFKMFERHPGGSSLYAAPATAAALRDNLSEVEVEAISLDEYFEPGRKIDLLKVDAEGAEPHVLRGARRLLTENSDVVVIIEYSPQILEGAHGSVEGFWDEVRALGFKVFEIMGDGSLRPSPSELSLQHCDLILRR